MQTSRLLVSTAVLALSAGFVAPATAQQKIRPGLWENNISMKSQSGQMEAAMAQAQKALASLPPAQRKQMEQMLAAQGVSMSAGTQGQTTVKVCVSPEQADLDKLPQRDGCTQQVQRVDASTMQVSFQCKGGKGEPPSHGKGTVRFQSDKAYTGQFQINTTVNDKPEQMEMAQKGQWLSGDCGAIKPLPQER